MFDDPDEALGAARSLRAQGFEVADAYTPYAVHGMDEALAHPETRLPWATFVGGAIGGLCALALQMWTHAVDWPLNIGGKSNIAWPALIPVTFELVILFAALATVGTLLGSLKLWPRWRAPKNQPHPLVTDDRFVLVIAERDASFAISRFRSACAELGAKEVIEAWRVT